MLFLAGISSIYFYENDLSIEKDISEYCVHVMTLYVLVFERLVGGEIMCFKEE